MCVFEVCQKKRVVHERGVWGAGAFALLLMVKKSVCVLVVPFGTLVAFGRSSVGNWQKSAAVSRHVAGQWHSFGKLSRVYFLSKMRIP